MAIRFSRVWAVGVACALSISAALPAFAAENRTLTVPGAEFSQETDGTFTARIVTDPFDRAAIYWESDQNPVVSVRVLTDGSEDTADWQPIEESGQTYLHRMGGLFDFSQFGESRQSLTVEIRIEKNREAGLRQIRLELTKETSDAASTIVMVVVMAAAGGILYWKKKNQAAA